MSSSNTRLNQTIGQIILEDNSILLAFSRYSFGHCFLIQHEQSMIKGDGSLREIYPSVAGRELELRLTFLPL